MRHRDCHITTNWRKRTTLMSKTTLSSVPTTLDAAAPDFWVQVQFRPALGRVPQFSANLAKAISEPVTIDGSEVPVKVKVSFTGAAQDAANLMMTLAVSMGPEDQIHSFSAASLAGYGMLDRLFTQFSDYTPAYAAAPTAEEAETANFLRERLGFEGVTVEPAALAA